MQQSVSSGLRRTIIFLFMCLAAFLASRGLISMVDSGFSVGNALGALLPFSLGLACFLLFAKPDLFSLRVPRARMGLKAGSLILFLSPFFAFLLLHVGALARLLPMLIALIVFLTAMFLVATRDDTWGIIAFLLAEPFLSFLQWETPFLHPGENDLITLSYMALLLITGAAIARMLKRGSVHLYGTSLDKYILVFMIILFLSSIVSPDPAKSLRFFFQFALNISVFFLVSLHIHTKEDLRRWIEAYIVWEVFRNILFGYFSWRGIGFDFLELVSLRGIVSEKAPHAFGGPIALAISLAIIYSDHYGKKMYYIAAALIFFTTILIFQGREMLFIFLAGAPTILFYRRCKKWVILGLIVVFLALAASGIGSLFFHRHAELASVQGWQRALAMRLDGWKAGVSMLHDHPFTGIGLGMWEEFIPFYGTQFKMLDREGKIIHVYISSAHNGHLDYGVNAGILALLVSIGISLKALLRTLSVLKRVKDYEIHTLAVGLAWICIGMLLEGTYSYPRGYVDYAFQSWGIFATVMALGRVASLYPEGVEEGSKEDGIAKNMRNDWRFKSAY